MRAREYPPVTDSLTRKGEKKGLGRPSSYSEEIGLLIKRYVEETGGGNADVARLLGVQVGTIGDWCHAHPHLVAILKDSRDKFNSRKAEVSLLKRVTGYSWDEVSVEETTIKMGQGEKAVMVPAVKRKVVTRQVAPDVGAVIFWLCNRAPDRWQNVQNVLFEGNLNSESKNTSIVADLSKMGKVQLEALRAAVPRGEGSPLKLDGKRLRFLGTGDNGQKRHMDTETPYDPTAYSTQEPQSGGGGVGEDVGKKDNGEEGERVSPATTTRRKATI